MYHVFKWSAFAQAALLAITTSVGANTSDVLGLSVEAEGVDPVARELAQACEKMVSRLGVDGPVGPVYVALRRGGVLQSSRWIDSHSWTESFRSAINELLVDREATRDTLEIAFTFNTRDVSVRQNVGPLSNVHRGIHGLEIQRGEHIRRFSPTEMIARNLSFSRAIEVGELEWQRQGIQFRELDTLSVRVFDAHQFLVKLSESSQFESMYRGNRVVDLNEVTRSKTEALAESMGNWLMRQVREDGRLMYRYFPSRGEESTANNLIRQFMGSICLGRVAKARCDFASLDMVDRNLNYNFDTFYRFDGNLGYVEKDQKVKLGAVALAAMAIVEHPRRDAYSDIEAALLRTVDYLWQPNGYFRSWYRPAIRTDNQNFYPGEALLLWATLYDCSPSPALLEKFMASFHFYRQWHRENRNPAFIPWHTQAYFQMWLHTRDPELSAFILEMNDWLLDMQEWDRSVYPDLRGRFFDQTRPHFGPPHASSTGVYLEGLIDAFELAHMLGDHARRERYRVAIARGLRHVMQLQFDDDIDMFYVSRRDPVRGGIRTCVYDNTIRIDNVQHNLMAILKILDRFDDSDFRLE